MVAVVVAGVAVLLSGTPEPDPGTSSLVRLTALIPADEGAWMVQVADMEALRARAGVARPRVGASPEEVDAYVAAIRERGALPIGAFGHWLRREHAVEGWRHELGVDLAQVRAVASWGEPPDHVLVATGRFDATSVDQAVRNLADPWGPALVEERHRGVRIYSWWDDWETDLTRGTDLDPLGMSRRIAMVDDLFIITRSTSAMTSIIDAVLDGPRSPLADLAEIAARDGAHVMRATATPNLADESWLWFRNEPGRRTLTVLEPAGTDLDTAIGNGVDRVASELGWSDQMRAMVRIDRIGDRLVEVSIEHSDDATGEAMTRSVAGFLVTGEIERGGVSREELR